MECGTGTRERAVLPEGNRVRHALRRASGGSLGGRGSLAAGLARKLVAGALWERDGWRQGWRVEIRVPPRGSERRRGVARPCWAYRCAFLCGKRCFAAPAIAGTASARLERGETAATPALLEVLRAPLDGTSLTVESSFRGSVS